MPPSDSHARPASDAERRAALERMDRLARPLDSAPRVPGTRVTLGADSALNLIPGIGPLASKAMSAWIIWQARRLGAPCGLVLHVPGIVALDAAVGAVLVMGRAAEVVLRANRLGVLLGSTASALADIAVTMLAARRGLSAPTPQAA